MKPTEQKTSLNQDHVLTITALLPRVKEAIARQPFNPLSLLIQRETDLSRLFAWMLDARAEHGAGTTYLALFLEMIGLNIVGDLNRSRVETEANRYAGGKSVGRVDLQVEHPRFVILVENKPYAAFGDSQLHRYVSSLPTDGRDSLVVVMLGRGWSNEGIRHILPERHAVAFHLGTDVRDWVGACVARTPSGKVRDLLDTLREDLDIRHGGLREAGMEHIIDELTRDTETLAAAIAVIEVRDRLAIRVNRDFTARVSALARAAGLGVSRPIADETMLFGGNKHGTLRLDIGLDEFDAAIEAESTYFRDISFSISARRETKNIEARHSDLIAKLRQAFGPGSGESLVNWYAWWDWVDGLHVTGKAPVDTPTLWAWAADASAEGLASRFVAWAVEVKRILSEP